MQTLAHFRVGGWHYTGDMLIAYLDEIGETGAFVSKSDKRFNTSPAFGYAGFVIDSGFVTSMGWQFNRNLKTLFKKEYEDSRAYQDKFFEVKGAEIFHKNSFSRPSARANFRAFDAMVVTLVKEYGGSLFYYADEKPIGTDRQTLKEDGAIEKRESDGMRETLNRLARHASRQDQNILIVLDQINEKQRYQRAHRMYGHIYSRMREFEEMATILEPPMHVDSKFSSNMQFADWIAAFLSRAIEYQLIKESEYQWVVDRGYLKFAEKVDRPFTNESKLHLWQKSCDDFNNIDILQRERKLFPQHLDRYLDPEVAQKMRKIALASRRNDSVGTKV